MKTSSSTIVGVVSICIWSYAVYFALKWLGHMADHTITYNGKAAAIVLPALSVLVLFGAIGSVALFIMTKFGKVKPLWQNVILVLGIIAVLLISGD